MGSEDDADDVDDDDDEDDSSTRSNRIKQMKSEDDSAISKSSESAIAPNEGNDSSSDTEDDADKVEEDDEVDTNEGAPVPMARKVSVPADTTEELSREEYELSKRETVNVEDATRKISAVSINEESDSEIEEDADQGSDGEEESVKNTKEERQVAARSLSSSSEEADESGPIIVDADNVHPRANGGAEIRRPQFRHSSSS